QPNGVRRRIAHVLGPIDNDGQVVAGDGAIAERRREQQDRGGNAEAGRRRQPHDSRTPARDPAAIDRRPGKAAGEGTRRADAAPKVIATAQTVRSGRRCAELFCRYRPRPRQRLPETNVEQALDRLVALDREKKILSRDILAIDLRLPDRVTVRLSDAAAAAREEALKEKKKKKG